MLTSRLLSLSAAIDLIDNSMGKTRDRWFAIVAMVAAVLLTGTLLLLHRPSAKVLIETKASEVEFTVKYPFFPLRGVAGITPAAVVQNWMDSQTSTKRMLRKS